MQSTAVDTSLNRLTEISYNAGGTGVPATPSLRYDANGNLTQNDLYKYVYGEDPAGDPGGGGDTESRATVSARFGSAK